MASSRMMNRSSKFSTKFDWKIENFSMVDILNGLDSDVFSAGGFKWKARVFPKGWKPRNVTVSDHISLYLFSVGLKESEPLSVEVNFGIISQTDCTNTMRKGMIEGLYLSDSVIGWEKFMLLSEFHDPDKGYVVNDACIIRVEFTCEIIEDGAAVKGSHPDNVSETGKLQNKRRKATGW